MATDRRPQYVSAAAIASGTTERTIPPTVGYTGFRGAAAQTPPLGWVAQHQLAEGGGFYREGRRWTRLPIGTVLPTDCMPTRVLYRWVISRGVDAALTTGYTIDA